MDEIDRYVNAVLRCLPAAGNREGIAADLRAHLEAAVQAGEPPQAVIARMGTPEEVAAEFMAQVELTYASFLRRLAAFAIDMAAILLVAAPFGLTAVLLANLVPQHPQRIELLYGGLLILLTIGCGAAVPGLLILYFPILEGRFGQTLGKYLLGIQVVRENGLPIHYKEAFLRRISYYFEVFVVDALFIPFTARRQRAFDIVARTVVIRKQGA